MKRIAAFFITFILACLTAGIVISMTACATSPTSRRSLTPKQIAAQVCPAAQVTAASLASLQGLAAPVRADLDTAGALVQAACAAGAEVDLTSLATLNRTALPILLRVVETAGLDAAEHDRIVLGLTVGQIVLQGALQAAGRAP